MLMNMSKEKMELLSKKLTDCSLSVRALCCLMFADIETVGDLVQYKKNELLMFRNFGNKTISELDDFLHDNGLDWGMKF